MTVMQDLENYRKMSEPFPNVTVANDALQKFFEAVSQARKEYEIPDAHVIVQMNMVDGGEERKVFTSAHFGNSSEAIVMCAWSYGREQASQQAHLEKLLANMQATA